MELIDILKIYRWSLPTNEWAAIKFLNDNTYLLGMFGEGGEPFCRGTYGVMDDKVVVNYPYEITDWLLAYESSKEILAWMFPQKRAESFTYDSDHMDFYAETCLRNGNKILTNHSIQSPFGGTYDLDGFDVIKYDARKNYVIVTENLRMRERPSVRANPVNLTVYIVGIDLEFKGDITYKDAIHSFDAVTVKNETIDGITAPWYHISVVLNEVYSRSVWVFGGYLRRISEADYQENSVRYYKNYYDTLFKLNVVRKGE